MFFEFNQNNTGGSFDFDEESGITHYVLIEADNAEDANTRAEAIGIYFDGCDTAGDCPCCGDRWNRAWSDEGAEEPEYYGQPVAEATSSYSWMEEGKEIAVHYKDGRIEWFGVKEDK